METIWASLVGWLASAILIATLARQVWTQSQSKSDVGVSAWLFAGQITASVLFFVYSLMLKNWVFVVSNAMILITAITGQIVFYRNRNGRAAGQRHRRS
jgi:lipid-A-disaccharide synthase-like uncharacterized protein